MENMPRISFWILQKMEIQIRIRKICKRPSICAERITCTWRGICKFYRKISRDFYLEIQEINGNQTDKEWKTNISRRPSHYLNHRLEGILGTSQKTPAMAFPLGWTPPHDSDRTRSESADSESRPTTLEAIIRRRSSNMKGWTVL